MSWKTAYRSMYYEGAPEPDDPDLSKPHTALLIIDVQNTYLDRRTAPRCPPKSSAATTPGRRFTSACTKSCCRAPRT